MRVRFCLANRKWIAVSSDILIVDCRRNYRTHSESWVYLKNRYMHLFICINLFLYSSYWSYWNVKQNNWIIYLYFSCGGFFFDRQISINTPHQRCVTDRVFLSATHKNGKNKYVKEITESNLYVMFVIAKLAFINTWNRRSN